MKPKIPILFISILSASVSWSQGIYISPSANLFISAGTLFSVDSLVIVPSAGFNITGENAQTKNATITNPFGNLYIKRVFRFLNTTTPFTGNISIYYLDTELNGLAENALILNVHNGTSWNAYTTGITRDDINNFVTTTRLTNILLNELTLAGLSSPLPVNFSLFNAVCITGGVTLTWKTAQEQGSKNFEVQRSVNGLSWQAIASISAAGNSTVERSYSYTDNSSADNSLYRIAEYDINGRSTISFTLRSSCILTNSFAVYPNPVRNTALINIHVNAATTASLRLYDAKGALVKIMEASLLPGSNQLPVDMKGLTNGWYHLTTKWGNTVKEVRIIKE
jgi:hypothetical protein